MKTKEQAATGDLKPLEQWTRKEFSVLPDRKWGEDIGEFDSLIILPLRRLHDSGFRCLDFVAAIGNKPICLLSGCSDIIHIDGIGGYGYNWLQNSGGIPNTVVPVGWNIDCLKTSGLLRIFTGGKLIAGEALSSFEIYAIKNNNKS